MKTGAEPALPLAEDRQTASVTPIRALPLDPDPRAEEQARLIRRLAGDRLRELRDDGVTPSYIARIYGVELSVIEDTMQSLGLLVR
ncbi:MAG TPA: hypothetical protein VF665_18185 [Longimicrobium sp.]|jgi:hypothetical protein|uniref:hypothetical protein n=1 Tax=Longimicrobium sp. TaxID=2029185 RepID=UPI002EDA33EB